MVLEQGVTPTCCNFNGLTSSFTLGIGKWLGSVADSSKQICPLFFSKKTSGIVCLRTGQGCKKNDARPWDVKSTRISEKLGFQISSFAARLCPRHNRVDKTELQLGIPRMHWWSTGILLRLRQIDSTYDFVAQCNLIWRQMTSTAWIWYDLITCSVGHNFNFDTFTFLHGTRMIPRQEPFYHLHVCRTGQGCRWPWDVKSTSWKANARTHELNLFPLGKDHHYALQTHFLQPFRSCWP